MSKKLQIFCLATAFGCLGACQTTSNVDAEKESQSSSATSTATEAVRQTRDGFSDAATAPFEDLNLKREKIPTEITAFITPYDPLTDYSCDAIKLAILELNSVLDPDIDEQVKQAQEGTKDKKSTSEHASDFALGQIASEARSLIPFRGLVRQVTGANAHEKKVDRAYEIAYLRRSYLKGFGHAKGCDLPAAPIPLDYDALRAPQAPIQYKTDAPED